LTPQQLTQDHTASLSEAAKPQLHTPKAMQAMYKMKKFDIAELERAAKS